MNKVIIIDENRLFAEGVKYILMENNKVTDVHLLSIQEATFQVIQNLEPKFVLIDDSISINFIKLIKNIEDLKIIMLTTEPKYDYVQTLLNLGVHGYLLKDISINTLYECIDVVEKGESYIHYKLSNMLLNTYPTKRNSHNETLSESLTDANFSAHHFLTKRECEVLQLLSEGLSNRLIGQELSISEATVKQHISRMFNKLEVNDRLSLVLKAIKHGWVDIDYKLVVN